MNLKLLYESKNHYYHATSYDRLPSIIKNGLIPSPSRTNKTPLGNNFYLSKEISYANYMGSEYYSQSLNGKLVWVLIEIPELEVNKIKPYLDEGYIETFIDYVLKNPSSSPELKMLARKLDLISQQHPNTWDDQEWLQKIAPIIDQIPTMNLENQINFRFRDHIKPEQFSAVYVVGYYLENGEIGDDSPQVLKIYQANNPTYQVGDEM